MQGTVDLMVPVAGGALATSDHAEAASMPYCVFRTVRAGAHAREVVAMCHEEQAE
jgi:hypothetical protein